MRLAAALADPRWNSPVDGLHLSSAPWVLLPKRSGSSTSRWPDLRDRSHSTAGSGLRVGDVAPCLSAIGACQLAAMSELRVNGASCGPEMDLTRPLQLGQKV